MTAASTPAQSLIRLFEVYGFGRSDVAELLGIRVPDLRAWCHDPDSIPQDGRRALAELVAFSDTLAEHVEEPATWLNKPLVDGFNVRPADLYRTANSEQLRDLATGRREPTAVLDEIEPQWRAKWRSYFEVFTAADGELSMRPRRCTCEKASP